jgi:hypothetical protein
MKYLISLFVLSASTLSAADALYDFRQTAWGMTAEQVIEAEGREPDKKEDIPEINGYRLMYTEIPLLGEKVAIRYDFNSKGKLFQSMLTTYEQFPAPIRHVDVFNRFFEVLKEKYGEPTTVLDRWLQDKDYYDRGNGDLGQAIRAGGLMLVRRWNVEDRTNMTLGCSSSDRRVFVRIWYEDIKAIKEVQQEQKAKSGL